LPRGEFLAPKFAPSGEEADKNGLAAPRWEAELGAITYGEMEQRLAARRPVGLFALANDAAATKATKDTVKTAG
jgi:hypothetical protein